MTSILGSIAERIWVSTQSLPSGPPFNAYVEQLRGLSRELRTYVNHMESRLAQDARKSLLDSPFEVTTGRPGLVRCRGCHSGWSAPNQSFCSKCQESASRPKGGYQCTACGKPSSMDLCPLTSDGYHRPFGPVSLADAADITTKRVEAGTARTTQFKPEVPKDPRISAIETPKDQNIGFWQGFDGWAIKPHTKDPIWIADCNDWRLKAPPRGDGAITNGGWRCAGAMGQTTSRGDHLISAPFYVTDPSSDTRHCCYCEACALELCGVKWPGKIGRSAMIYTQGTEKIRDQLQGSTPEMSGPKGTTGAAQDARAMIYTQGAWKTSGPKSVAGAAGPTSPKSEPRYVQCISCGQEAQQGLTSTAKPCWLGPSHVWEPVSLRERILEPKKTREHILLTVPGEQVPVARLTPDQARELGIQLIYLSSGYGK